MLPDLSGQPLDRYQLVHLLGAGGFGQVYLAKDRRQPSSAPVVLKLLTSCPLASADLQAFLNAARTLLRLRHAHILPLLDLGFERKRSLPFLVMAYAPGGSLRQHLPPAAHSCPSPRSCRRSTSSPLRCSTLTTPASSTSISSLAMSCAMPQATFCSVISASRS